MLLCLAENGETDNLLGLRGCRRLGAGKVPLSEGGGTCLAVIMAVAGNVLWTDL